MNWIFIIGIVIYTIFEGLTESMTWYNRTITSSLYHMYRVLETLGVALMLVGLYGLYPNLLQGIQLAIGTILFGFVMYRGSFIIASEQDTISPDWSWDVQIPFTDKIININYPPDWIVIPAGLIGFWFLITA